MFWCSCRGFLKHSNRERRDGESFTHWFIPPMTATNRDDEPGQRQQPGTPFGFPTRVSESLDSSHVLPSQEFLVGSRIGSEVVGAWTGAHIWLQQSRHRLCHNTASKKEMWRLYAAYRLCKLRKEPLRRGLEMSRKICPSIERIQPGVPSYSHSDYIF